MPPAAPNLPDGTLRVLKVEGGCGVYLVRGQDGSLEVLKRWPATIATRFKRLVGLSQAQRQLRGAERLRDAGVATPEPRSGPAIEAGYLRIRLAWVEGVVLLDRVLDAAPTEQRQLGKAMGEILRRLHSAGLFHRDGKLSNFIVTPDGSLVAIDPVGVRRSRDRRAESRRLEEILRCELRDRGRGAEDRARWFLEAALAWRRGEQGVAGS